MTKTLTYKDARHALDDVLRKHGKKMTYAMAYENSAGEAYNNWDKCKYQIGGTPTCIIGVLLDNLGVEYSKTWEGETIHTLAPFIEDQIEFTPKALLFLALAQTNQDGQLAWGKSVKMAAQSVNQKGTSD